jgi:uncharacterized protein YjlB
VLRGSQRSSHSEAKGRKADIVPDRSPPASPDVRTQAIWLADDGLVPNNANLPLIVYRQAFAAGDAAAEERIEAVFAANGWSGAWVNGIYPFHHYHATTHEVLGVARGTAQVQFGGPAGPVLDVAAGDAVMIPAGVGHCRLSAAAGLSVVGAYPGGSDWDLRRATPEDYRAALPLVAVVAAPPRDPILGSAGPACQPHAR